MSNKKNIFFIILILIFSCKSTTDSAKKVDCKTYAIKSVNQIYETNYTLNINGLSKDFIQLGFCTYNPSVVSQIIYDDFGQWDKIIYEESTKKPLLFWENIYFEKIKSKVNIISSSSYDSLSWILIYNNDSFDYLSSESIHKKIITEYIINKINTNTNRKESSFYEIYWRNLNPERWQEIMRYRKRNEN